MKPLGDISRNDRLKIGFILARSFTLSAFAVFVDTLRLALIEIAMEAGFKSVSHFAKLFRKADGVSPTAWRTLPATDTAA